MPTSHKLAILGGEPSFQQPLHVGYPLVESESKDLYLSYMNQVFSRNILTNQGPMVERLELEIARLHRVEHCAVVCNGTVAQLLAMKAMELSGEVILPSFTFIATAHACLWQNLTPVFCDIRTNTLMINPDQVQALITPHTCAVVGVHLFGNTCEAEKLEDICRAHEIKLIFDAAHAFDCSRGERHVGGFGDVEFFSFHATKFFNTFEGGAVLTNNEKIIQRVKLLRNFGFKGYDEIGFLGINGKMSESSAAMGLAALPNLEKRRDRLKLVHHLYSRHLTDIPGVALLPVGLDGQSNFHYAVLRIDQGSFGISRNQLYEVLWRENIRARRYFSPGCHRSEPYASNFDSPSSLLRVTEEACDSVLCLPTNIQPPAEVAAQICKVIAAAHENKTELRRLIPSCSRDSVKAG